MKAAAVIFILLFTARGTLVKGNTPPYTTQKERVENMILKKIHDLLEVKEFLRETPKSYKPSIIIAAVPDSTTKYYWIKVGISNFNMFRTNFNFYVSPKTFKILYWDELCDSDNCNITLQQWRYWRKTPGWQKMHTYKNGNLVVLAK